MSQALTNRSLFTDLSGCCNATIFRKNFTLFSILFSVFIFGTQVSCNSKANGGKETSTSNSNSQTNSSEASQTSIPQPNPGKGFPSLNELRELLANDPSYAGFVRCLNTDALMAYINVRDEYDFALLVPNEKNQDPAYVKKYLSEEADPRDRLNFWLSHMTVASKGIPWEGNPSIYQVMLKRNGSVISYEGGSANITKEKTLKDGTQIIFIDKPIKINVRN